MDSKERRERERQELKQSILRAAREIASQEGWQSVTIRKVAELIKYSPPAIYDYFESKEAILRELVREGFDKLLGRLRAAYNSTADPRERLVRLSVAHVEFARDNPELYQVMHGMGGAVCNTGDPPEMHELGGIMIGAFRAAAPDIASDRERLQIATDIHFATLHGLISLTLEGLFPPGGWERTAHLVDHATRSQLACLDPGSDSRSG